MANFEGFFFGGGTLIGEVGFLKNEGKFWYCGKQTGRATWMDGWSLDWCCNFLDATGSMLIFHVSVGTSKPGAGAFGC